MYMWLLDSLKHERQTLQLNSFPVKTLSRIISILKVKILSCKNFKQNYINTECENLA